MIHLATNLKPMVDELNDQRAWAKVDLFLSHRNLCKALDNYINRINELVIRKAEGTEFKGSMIIDNAKKNNEQFMEFYGEYLKGKVKRPAVFIVTTRNGHYKGCFNSSESALDFCQKNNFEGIVIEHRL